LTDSAVGRVASFSGDNATLRLEAQPNAAAADEAAATKWVETARPGAEVVSLQTTTRLDLSGFAVAYTFADVDGNAQSGFAVLLNGVDGTLYSANLRFNAANVDLNTEEGRTAQPTLAQVMDTFTVLADLNVLLPTPTPSPTPLASATPTTEVTAEATVEPTVAPTATATMKPTLKPTTEPTALPTLKPTNVPPTAKPTTEPTALPTVKPTNVPPTASPTAKPTKAATAKPTVETTVEATTEATPSK
ncbi:MAG TPA: hypothetical protein VHO69_19050, partial [Phototrophicaceae bacterium]|nr:hypothetical protein [Phototrophicaceae bacterium]